VYECDIGAARQELVAMVTRPSCTGQVVLVHILNVSGIQISEVLPDLAALRNLVCGGGTALLRKRAL